MQNVLILGYDNNLQGQILKGYLQVYGGKWANISCVDICFDLQGNPKLLEILKEDSIPLTDSSCLTLEEAQLRFWDFVICPKPVDKLRNRLEHLNYGKLFSFEASDLMDLSIDVIPAEELEPLLESMRKKVLIFIGKELLGEPETQGATS